MKERHFTVAVFIVREGRVLLLFHRAFQRWLPPGGHLQAGEIPDDAAMREVFEETGLMVRFPDSSGSMVPGGPRLLTRPAGIQLENPAADHEHIDMVYFAAPVDPCQEPRVSQESEAIGWFGPHDWPALGVDAEIQAWCTQALQAGLED